MISTDDRRELIKGRFDWCGDSMIDSYFDGIMGTGFAECGDAPRWAAIRSGDFCYVAGTPVNVSGLAGYITGQMGGEAVIVPEGEDWLGALNEHGAGLESFKRYRVKLPEEGLDRELPERYAESIGGCDCMRMVRAGEREYMLMKDCEWENSFVSNFGGMEDFLKNGFAYVIYVGDEFASAASTYGYYKRGYELQIATAPKFRRRGLAAAAAAAWLLECMRRGKIPNWDAANMTSVGIAERLGLRFGGEYTALRKRKDQEGKTE